VWKQTVVAYFKVPVLSQHLTAETKKNRETSANIGDLATEIRNPDLPKKKRRYKRLMDLQVRLAYVSKRDRDGLVM
jgi:hypothetical protein